ncbi:MAG: hypothetical protein GY925_02225 [Actinomycetia bacterium]|nr:hypothetical protein [Actinomycetes bacterium]
MTEHIYVTWGGSGRGASMREAVERARHDEAGLAVLAVLDESFDDIDVTLTEVVIDELTWLLRAQVRQAKTETNSETVATRVLVRRGSLAEVAGAAVRESNTTMVLLGAPTSLGSDELALLSDQLGVATEVVGRE